MKNRRNYYRILQVQADAPIEVIRSSYRTLMRELKQHPDLGGSAAKAALINEAYETIGDAKRRAEYDRKMSPPKRKSGVPRAADEKPPPAVKSCPLCRTPLDQNACSGERCPDCEIPLRRTVGECLDQKHRRAMSRMQKRGRILYFSSWPQKAREAEMLDLSPKGMRFLGSERLESGTVLKINTPLLTASAIVTNVHQKEKAGQMVYSIGVSFVAVAFGDSKGSFLSVTA